MGQPFARAHAMLQAIVAIIETTASAFAARDEIAKLGEYKSRGHGGGFRANGSRMFVMRKLRTRSDSKYSPHQGAREIARRLRQGVAHG